MGGGRGNGGGGGKDHRSSAHGHACSANAVAAAAASTSVGDELESLPVPLDFGPVLKTATQTSSKKTSKRGSANQNRNGRGGNANWRVPEQDQPTLVRKHPSVKHLYTCERCHRWQWVPEKSLSDLWHSLTREERARIVITHEGDHLTPSFQQELDAQVKAVECHASEHAKHSLASMIWCDQSGLALFKRIFIVAVEQNHPMVIDMEVIAAVDAVIQDFCASVLRLKQSRRMSNSALFALLLTIVLVFWLLSSAWTWVVALISAGIAIHQLWKSLPPLDPRSFAVGSDLWVQYREREHIRLMWMSATVRVFEVRLIRVLERRLQAGQRPKLCATPNQKPTNGETAVAASEIPDLSSSFQHTEMPKKRQNSSRRQPRRRRGAAAAAATHAEAELDEASVADGPAAAEEAATPDEDGVDAAAPPPVYSASIDEAEEEEDDEDEDEDEVGESLDAAPLPPPPPLPSDSFNLLEDTLPLVSETAAAAASSASASRFSNGKPLLHGGSSSSSSSSTGAGAGAAAASSAKQSNPRPPGAAVGGGSATAATGPPAGGRVLSELEAAWYADDDDDEEGSPRKDGGDEIDAEFARRVQEHFQIRMQAAGKDLRSQTQRGNEILKSLCEKLKTELERAVPA